MNVYIIKCLVDNFSYVLVNKENDAIIIDPSESKPIINFAEKNNLNVKYILNTHHHDDHIGGNLELKKKFRLKIIGYAKDKHRIPGIDIEVENKQVLKIIDLEFKTYHVPGHTKGHVCFYFFNEDTIFTGDTLFSLGCGRIFEGTYKQMFESLKIIKSLPLKTKIYCGHEYTYSNAKFCEKFDKSYRLKKKIKSIEDCVKNGIPTIPTTIKDEKKLNIFLKAENLKTFSKLRNMKDNF